MILHHIKLRVGSFLISINVMIKVIWWLYFKISETVKKISLNLTNFSKINRLKIVSNHISLHIFLFISYKSHLNWRQKAVVSSNVFTERNSPKTENKTFYKRKIYDNFPFISLLRTRKTFQWQSREDKNYKYLQLKMRNISLWAH